MSADLRPSSGMTEGDAMPDEVERLLCAMEGDGYRAWRSNVGYEGVREAIATIRALRPSQDAPEGEDATLLAAAERAGLLALDPEHATELLASIAGPEGEATWTCFHCGDEFTDPHDAREHFGDRGSDQPVCRSLAAKIATRLRGPFQDRQSMHAAIRDVRSMLAGDPAARPSPEQESSEARVVAALRSVAERMSDSTPLDAETQRVIADNLWDLYESAAPEEQEQEVDGETGCETCGGSGEVEWDYMEGFPPGRERGRGPCPDCCSPASEEGEDV